jgi:hypothetical protein
VRAALHRLSPSRLRCGNSTGTTAGKQCAAGCQLAVAGPGAAAACAAPAALMNTPAQFTTLATAVAAAAAAAGELSNADQSSGVLQMPCSRAAAAGILTA